MGAIVGQMSDAVLDREIEAAYNGLGPTRYMTYLWLSILCAHKANRTEDLSAARALPHAQTVTYADALTAARELLFETISDPTEGHPEYTRGIVNLIADLFSRFEMDIGTRMDEVARELGVTFR